MSALFPLLVGKFWRYDVVEKLYITIVGTIKWGSTDMEDKAGNTCKDLVRFPQKQQLFVIMAFNNLVRAAA
jgi:dihydroorotate dehydrogenase